MSACKYYDCGFCYAPDDVETSASPQSACFDPDYCLYLKSQMTTEIEKTKKEIEVLLAKLALLEELSQTKSPVEEAFKDNYGVYPNELKTTDDFNCWKSFKRGYNAAQKDYKVGEHQEPEPKEPKTLYQIIYDKGWCESHCNEFCDIVKEWIYQYDCDYVMCEEYLKGYEECQTVLEEMLK